MHIKKISFTGDFRNFSKGKEIEFPNRVTVIVGDNGAGKSSLVGALRSQFKTSWSLSQIHSRNNDLPVLLEPLVPKGTPMTYVDLASDFLKTQATFNDEHMSLHVSTLHKSSGQAALLQLAGMMRETKATAHIIDEPERGLSPGKAILMAEVLATLIDERPEDQFFVVTHSLPIMSRLAEEVLYLPYGIYCPPEFYWNEMQEYGAGAAKKYAEAKRQERSETTPG